MKKKKLLKRFIVLNLIILLLVGVTTVLIIAFGNQYTLHTHFYVSENNVPEFSVTFDNDGVLNVTGVRIEDEEVVVDLHSLGKGHTELTIENTYIDENGESRGFQSKYRFYVSSIGTIFERTYDSINFTAYKAVIYEILIVLMLLIGFMCWSFIDCFRKGRFSYPMVAYGGAALFSALLLVLIVYKMMNNVVNSFSQFISVIESSGEMFLVLMLPVMVVLAVGVSVSNIWLMHHEGYRPVNSLGIAVSIFWLAGMMLTVFNWTTWLPFSPGVRSDVHKIFVYMVSYFECMLVSTILCAVLSCRYKPAYNKDYIMILGCAIRDDGTLTPLLRGRADAALRFEREQFDKTGRHAVFVPSGGQGADEVISEGEAMKRYLMEQGISEERILPECRSVNTFENFKLSYEVMNQHDSKPEEKQIAFATTNYHIFRGYILSAKNGFRAEGISAGTKWYFFPNAFLREFIGLLYEQKIRHLLFVILTVLFFIAL